MSLRSRVHMSVSECMSASDYMIYITGAFIPSFFSFNSGRVKSQE